MINDHFGDALWRVGRRLEAKFQWQHAKDNKPEPKDLANIERKINEGLGDLPKAPPAAAATISGSSRVVSVGMIVEAARAKVNLALHVLGRRRWLHDLDSIVVFADVADGLTVTPAEEWSLAIAGPLPPISAPERTIWCCVRQGRWSSCSEDASARPAQLDKNLPVASGIGGGSADAAAAIRGLLALSASRKSRSTSVPSRWRLVPTCRSASMAKPAA